MEEKLKKEIELFREERKRQIKLGYKNYIIIKRKLINCLTKNNKCDKIES